MSGLPFRVKALYEYSSGHEDDLKFPNAQIITVTEEEDDDWYLGEYLDESGQKHEGMFPRNFVERFEPETPPRPARPNRSKKEPDKAPPEETPSVDAAASRAPEDANDDTQTETVPRSVQPSVTIPPPNSSHEAQPTSASTAKESTTDSPPTPNPKSGPKPASPAQSKPPAPVVADKPASGSFRDRIAAFNKPAAPPVAPFKPGGLGSSGSSFIKKPFVAPPPSKNAYVPPPREVPPQRVYRREEDPDLNTPQDVETLSAATDVPETVPSEQQTEDQPKPTSLKDRIALLQKQQLEQAARHADAAQRKDQARKAAKQQAEAPEDAEHEDGSRDDRLGGDNDGNDDDDEDKDGLTRMKSADTVGRDSGDRSRDDVPAPTDRPPRRKPSREPTFISDPPIAQRDMQSDANDADQSGAGETTEDAEEASTERDDSDYKSAGKPPLPIAGRSDAAISRGGAAGEGDKSDDDGAEEEDEEEENIDPEIKRRMEIRERMAKMSGGMGMPGMFGAAGGMPSAGSKKAKHSGSSEKKTKTHQHADEASTGSPPAQAAPVPIMPLPSRPRVASPEQDDGGDGHDQAQAVTTTERGAASVPEVEDIKPQAPAPLRRSSERPVPRTPQHDRSALDRSAPPTPSVTESGPPPLPAARPVPPPPPADARVPPTQPPALPLSPSAGSESDDEMSLHAKRLSVKTPTTDDSGQDDRGIQPPVPARPGPASPQSPDSRRPPGSALDATPTSPTAPDSTSKRSTRPPPPIPGATPIVHVSSQARAPPPPPPTVAPPSRRSTGDAKPLASPRNKSREESDEEVTEYDGDYDTDIAPGAKHKDALKSHNREGSFDESSALEETSSQVAPANVPPPIPQFSLPRGAPPPPPPSVQPQGASRSSADMPRAVPPPPPPPKQSATQDDDDEYDPYRYNAPAFRPPARPTGSATVTPVRELQEDDLYDRYQQRATPPQPPPPPPPASSQQQTRAPPPPVPAEKAPSVGKSLEPNPARTGPRQSHDTHRAGTGSRRSGEAGRPSGEHSHIATDVDLGQRSQWWLQPGLPPPVFQNRRDVLYEVEDSGPTRRADGSGGSSSSSDSTSVTKEVYALFHDYSQTIVTARFNTSAPHEATLTQRHEPPPHPLRQDQLEAAHARFGSTISTAAALKQNLVVGDGDAQSFILDLLRPLAAKGALLPVGSRAYGALVYANLANASVTQHDELRAGDIIAFRNARFQGHRGGLHSKYSAEAGKPEHVGVVVDWDGTKKKVRVWEQGRESKKVKMESFRLGDLRSGEVKIFRVVERGWVGWS
ncbi:MAG: hypothetical protein M1825_001446 [Sarcosagium campestre]|nr:MAG: hypothetical protein M1825_001446 [Sarcosagium campestre]